MLDALWFAGLYRFAKNKVKGQRGDKQALEVYHDEAFADNLANWGADHTWPEIQFLLGHREGVALDLACGSAPVWSYLKQYERIEYHGCDYSDLLIRRAVERGVTQDRVAVMDATQLTYPDGMFDYVFSIGSLEHFTEDGLKATIAGAKRVCRGINLHMVPVSASGVNEGWFVGTQSYWNNSERWWLDLFEREFGKRVWVMTSKWSDPQSLGRWFICVDERFGT